MGFRTLGTRFMCTIESTHENIKEEIVGAQETDTELGPEKMAKYQPIVQE